MKKGPHRGALWLTLTSSGLEAAELHHQREFPPDDVELGLGVVDSFGGLGHLVLGGLDLGRRRKGDRPLPLGGDRTVLGGFDEGLPLSKKRFQHCFGAGELTLGLGEFLLVPFVERDRPLVNVQPDPCAVLTLEVAGERATVGAFADRDRDLPALLAFAERRDLILHCCVSFVPTDEAGLRFTD